MSIKPAIDAPPKRRISSSSSETKKRDEPGSPWRPARPRSWLSMRRASWRSVPSTCSPPSSRTRRASRSHCSLAARQACSRCSSVASWLDALLLQESSTSPSGLPPSKMSTPRRHVGGDGDRAGPPRLRDDPRLTLVLLGVQHLVRDALAVSSSLRRSDFSTDVVPTSTGRPLR